MDAKDDTVQDQEELNRFFSISLEMMCVANFEGYFVRLNPAFEENLGYTLEELKERRFFDFIHPEDVEPTLREMDKLSQGASTLHFENRYQKKNGDYIWMLWIARPEFEQNRIYAAARDITVIKENEKALIAAREAAVKANRAKSDFLANMSHEIRTPMNAVLGYTECLLEGMDGPINDQQRNSLNRVLNAGRHLLDLINMVLDISKIEAGKSELHCECFDLVQLADMVLDTMGQLAMEKGLVLEFKGPGTYDFFGDAPKIRQVLLNLVGNAIKFTHEGCVKVAIQRIPASREAEIVVSDTGIGIPKEKQEEIFEAFHQADSSTTKEYGGTGLGLTIVREYVDLHGGSLEMTSCVGEGSAFTIFLPEPCALNPVST